MVKLSYPLLILTLAILFSSCLQHTEYPPVPRIFEPILLQMDDGATLSFRFEDGDGDIGLSQSDTTGVFCTDSCLYHWNLFLEYYEKVDGEWEHQYIDWMNPDNVPFYYRIPLVSPSGQDPALVGSIELDMPGFYYLLSDNDTARFEILLVDRALNESNLLTTEPFIKPK